MLSLKLRKARKELKEVLKEKEKNLIRIIFDRYIVVQKYKNVESTFESLKEEKRRLEQQWDIQNKMGGKTTKTKEAILETEKQLKEVDAKIKGIEKMAGDIKGYEQVIPAAERFIARLKDCIKNPQKIYDVKKTFQERKTP